MHRNSLFYSKMNAIIFLEAYAHYTNYRLVYYLNCELFVLALNLFFSDATTI